MLTDTWIQGEKDWYFVGSDGKMLQSTGRDFNGISVGFNAYGVAHIFEDTGGDAQYNDDVTNAIFMIFSGGVGGTAEKVVYSSAEKFGINGVGKATAKEVAKGVGEAVNIPKSVERQVKKLTPEARKGYDKAIEALKSGDTRGLNEHPLTGNRAGQWAVDIKGTGRGRGAGRVIFQKNNDGSIDIIEILTDHKY